jgi:hypothetical protein
MEPLSYDFGWIFRNMCIYSGIVKKYFRFQVAEYQLNVKYF